MLISSFGQLLLTYGSFLIIQSLSAYALVTLEIVSATWGGADFTKILQYRYTENLSKTNGVDPSFTFTANNDLFTNDPNPGINKVAVVVYRAFFGEAGQFSNFKTVAVKESETTTLTAPRQSDGIWQPPALGARNQFIISATWSNKDVTNPVKQQWSQSVNGPSIPSLITVSVAALGPDPAFGTNKQLSVTYANLVNGLWQFRVAVSLNQSGNWKLPILPAIYSPRDLRLNIVSATWGGKDYTNWVRDQYISNSILNPPTDTNNRWSISPSNDFFGPDPNAGYRKTVVVGFRFGYKVGTTTGPLIDPKQPPIYTAAWWNNGNPAATATTDQYPIIEDFSDIQYVTLGEDSPFSLSLLSWPKFTTGSWGSQYQAVSDPTSQPPWVAFAVYLNTDVTEKVNEILFDQTQRGIKGPLKIPTSPAGLGITDPAPGVQRQQLSVFVGWPTANDVDAYEFRSFAGLNGAGDITIPRTPPAGGKQYPESYRGLTVRKVKFTNKVPTSSYPTVYGPGGARWNGAGEQNSARYHIFIGEFFSYLSYIIPSYRILPFLFLPPPFPLPPITPSPQKFPNHTKLNSNSKGQSTTVDLLTEGPKLKDGDIVSLGFYTDIIGTQIGDQVRVAEVANTDLIEVIYGEGVVYKLYLAGRVIQFVAEVAGLILLAIGK